MERLWSGQLSPTATNTSDQKDASEECESAEPTELKAASAVGHSEGGELDEGPAVVPPPPPAAKKTRKKPKARFSRPKALEGHNVFTHFPRHPDCEVCKLSSLQKARVYSGHGKEKAEDTFQPVDFADSITMDYIEVTDRQYESRKKDRYSLIVMDRATQWVMSYATPNKSGDHVKESLQNFLGPNVNPKHIYSDNGADLLSGVTKCGWAGVHDKSTPNRHETNGVIERNRRICRNQSVGSLPLLVGRGDELSIVRAPSC
jgi:hypothetical protein